MGEKVKIKSLVNGTVGIRSDEFARGKRKVR